MARAASAKKEDPPLLGFGKFLQFHCFFNFNKSSKKQIKRGPNPVK